jgi:hypothetical protein
MAQPAQAPRPLPEAFVVRTYSGNRQGYALYRWTDSGDDANNRKIHALQQLNHRELYYIIVDDTSLPVDYTTVQTKKAQGNVVRAMKWKYTRKVLRYNGPQGNRRYPVIHITNQSTTLPAHHPSTFIPIVDDNNPPAQQAQQAQTAPNAPNVPKVYPITTIPQHAIRAMLRDAAMQEESCPITGEDIDIVNGAITSCFHLFEKNAIATWLALPNSQDKCPVCNNKCNMFTV